MAAQIQGSSWTSSFFSYASSALSSVGSYAGKAVTVVASGMAQSAMQIRDYVESDANAAYTGAAKVLMFSGNQQYMNQIMTPAQKKAVLDGAINQASKIENMEERQAALSGLLKMNKSGYIRSDYSTSRTFVSSPVQPTAVKTVARTESILKNVNSETTDITTELPSSSIRTPRLAPNRTR